MKYLLILFAFLNFSSFAQTYTEKIAQHRANYKNDFLSDEKSPLKEADLEHLHFFSADSNYKTTADVVMLKDEKTFKMPTYDGSNKEFIRYAKINFNLKGEKFSLTLYQNIALKNNSTYRDYLFLPFTDESNGAGTYGGGRYIDLLITDIKKNTLEIDFNKAYNPYCAYSDGYRCPIPPEENNLPIPINAGEKNYTGKKKHKS